MAQGVIRARCKATSRKKSRVVVVIDSLGGTQTSVYDLESRLTSRTYNEQSQELRIDFDYDAMGRVATITRYSDEDLVAETDYLYDANGNATDIHTYDAGSTTLDH